MQPSAGWEPSWRTAASKVIPEFLLKYLRWDNVISHVPEPGVHVGGVGEGETFHFGGDSADDRVSLLVGLLHHTHIPVAWQYNPVTTRTRQIAAPAFCGFLPDHVAQYQQLGEPEHTSDPYVGDNQSSWCFIVEHTMQTSAAAVGSPAHLCATNTHEWWTGQRQCVTAHIQITWPATDPPLSWEGVTMAHTHTHTARPVSVGVWSPVLSGLSECDQTV